MPFPFLTPLPPWVSDIMLDREENQLKGSFKNPYAVLTSGAIVTKADTPSSEQDKRKKQLIKILNEQPSNKKYEGCIIANNINYTNKSGIGNSELSYSLGETVVGIDFNGNLIKVVGEANRKIPTPLIESIEIDTDGANNTLKTARVNLRLFSLKQLEMFQLFFMRPGLYILLEFGDGSLLKENLFNKIKSPYEAQKTKRKYNTVLKGQEKPIEFFTKPEQCLINKTGGLDKFSKEFSNYFRGNAKAFQEYVVATEKSLGTYDRVAGKIMDYSFSIQEDGTYDVMIEISSGNQVSLAIPANPKTQPKGTISGASEKISIYSKDQIVNLIVTDFGLGDGKLFKSMISTHPEQGGDWANDWFNFLKINEQQKDTVASEHAYLSLRFILKILLNYVIAENRIDKDFFEFKLPVWNLAGGGKEVYRIPVGSNKYIISSDEDIIFPTNELPEPIQPDPKKTDIELAAGNKYKDGTINGYNFHRNESLDIPADAYNNKLSGDNQGDFRIGDALNIFIKYQRVLNYWMTSATRIDFLEKILNLINENSYGMFTLSYGLQIEDGPPTVIDYKLANQYLKRQNQSGPIYRFKPGSLKSNVREFSFNFELSTLTAGRYLFNSSKLIAEAQSEKNGDNTENTSEYMALPTSVFKSIDNSNSANADGWWSINKVELDRVFQSYQAATQNTGSVIDEEQKPSGEKTATNETVKMTDLIDKKTVKFLNPKDKSKNLKLIYLDTALVQNKINKSEKDTQGKDGKPAKSILSPIEVSVTVDGFSGFTCGQYFKIQGVPEEYNKIGVFQITNIKHSVSANDWTTTIEAMHRVIDTTKEDV